MHSGITYRSWIVPLSTAASARIYSYRWLENSALIPCTVNLVLQSIIRAVNDKIQRAIDALWRQMVKHRNVAKGFANPVGRDTNTSLPCTVSLHTVQCFMLTARMMSLIAASTAFEKLASLILLKLSPLCYRHSNTCSALVSIRV